MSDPEQLTPMMAQYRRLKAGLPSDALLLFRLGDFYEMFFDDAQHSARILNVALTKRGEVPMCGVPAHAAENYIGKLLQAGRKVAICDQMEAPQPGKLVKREVTQILSPGTHFQERLLAADRPNYLAALSQSTGKFGLAITDLTTGEFKATELQTEADVRTELDRLQPAELILPAGAVTLRQLAAQTGLAVTGYDDWTFMAEPAADALRAHFKVTTLDGFGLHQLAAATGAAGAIVHYLKEHLRRNISHLQRLSTYGREDTLILDSGALRQLEIIEPLHRDSPSTATLFGALNLTVTPMGARRLREWLTQPLGDVAAICSRQLAVQQWINQPAGLESAREHLGAIRDMERTVNRLCAGTGNARDLVSLRTAFERLPHLKSLLLSLGFATAPGELTLNETPSGTPSLLRQLHSEIEDFSALSSLIARAIADEPPLGLRDGGMIREGFDAALDELRAAGRDGKNWIAQLQQQEILRTGIHTLKIRFNSVFGYYIEVTKSNLDKVPQEYIRKQTVANAERFITPELKAVEDKVLGAEDRATQLEYELFQQVREQLIAELTRLLRSAGALAQVDVLASFAETARRHDYCRPHIGTEGQLRIEAGRHPVLEQVESAARFVPNDTQLDTESRQIAVITGPNMAGKSTYIRQVALIAVMAHTGSFVPARSARVDLIDRLFTRIGANDNLSRGQSTFMVEMTETANLLNHATRQSLVILDEIGRGTSTFDGLSLAWAIAEHLHHRSGAKTLFATHYHELTDLAGRLPRVLNLNVAVREWNEQIIFLHQIVPGSADRSYGIHVARLAGLPAGVLDRAKQVLVNLESTELSPDGAQAKRSRSSRPALVALPKTPQLDLFSTDQRIL